jgi:DHA2 family multidrug resistance protein
MGIALATTLLARRSQYHQSTLGAHVNVWDPETAVRLKQWTGHFISQGADGFTAERRAVAMLYRGTTDQAQVLAYADAYVVLVAIFVGIILLLPFMRRVRVDQTGPKAGRGAPARAEPVPEPAD